MDANVIIGVLGLLVAAGAVALVVRTVRRSRSAGGTLSLAETVGVSIVGSGALLGIPLSLYGLVSSGIQLANATTVRVSGIALSNSTYPPFLQASDAPVDAGYETAWVEIANAPGDVRWLLWAEQALPTVLGLVIAVAVAWLSLALLRGAPFTRAFPLALGVLAVAVVAVGLGTQAVEATARAATVAFLGPAEFITGHDTGSGPVEGFMAYSLLLDLGPVGWGLGIALVAAAFSIGTRLQRDTAGLV
ncbi:hypothetical protein ACFXQA_03405 [Microbacterium sp. P07]|uniref:hypothetical protein n=1 Tax=Microbacterium sp. P07 TaxID=3366952 RepID=UPI003746E5D8